MKNKVLEYEGKTFELLNPQKLHRVLFGDERQQGIGEDASVIDILTAYDKMGGAIRMDGKKLMMGAFYDFAKKKSQDVPLLQIEKKKKAKPPVTVEKPGDNEGNAPSPDLDEEEEESDLDEEDNDEEEEEKEEEGSDKPNKKSKNKTK